MLPAEAERLRKTLRARAEDIPPLDPRVVAGRRIAVFKRADLNRRSALARCHEPRVPDPLLGRKPSKPELHLGSGQICRVAHESLSRWRNHMVVVGAEEPRGDGLQR